MKTIYTLFMTTLFGVTLSAQDITFSEHIAPIVYNNCTSCHRPGEIGPQSFTNYEEVKNWGNMIAFTTETRYMPPWRPNRDFSTFVGEKGLADEEIQRIQDWVSSGAPQGDPNLEPPLPEFPTGSQLGTPDLVLNMTEAFHVAGDNQDKYYVFVLPTNEGVDREIAAVEFRPGNPKVVHHALLSYDTQGQAAALDAQTPEYGYPSFGDFGIDVFDLFQSYTPGIQNVFYPKGIGKVLPANANVLIQIHYAPVAADENDQSHVNIFFKKPDDPIERLVNLGIVAPFHLVTGVNSFFILANEVKTFHGVYNISSDISLISVYPHCHLLGKDWLAYAITPDNDTIPIIQIEEWDFNWQGSYTFDRMKKIPAGSEMHVFTTYDNTSNNPYNPNNPPQFMTWGESTTDEMYLMGFNYVNYQEGDEDIIIDQGGTTGINNPIQQNHNKLYPPFPNPSYDQVRIGFYLKQQETIGIKLFDIHGRLVKILQPVASWTGGNHNFDINVKGLASGIYIVNLEGNDFTLTKKITVGN